MDTFSYHEYDSVHNYVQADAFDMVDASLRPAQTAGQRTLLELLPLVGDEIALDDAIDILSRTEPAPYGQIVTLLNRRALETAFADIRSVDAEIVLRRLSADPRHVSVRRNDAARLGERRNSHDQSRSLGTGRFASRLPTPHAQTRSKRSRRGPHVSRRRVRHPRGWRSAGPAVVSPIARTL